MAEPMMSDGLENLVKRSILALAHVNVRFDQHLEVIGSIHIRSDNIKVAGFMIDEHIYKDQFNTEERDDSELEMGSIAEYGDAGEIDVLEGMKVENGEEENNNEEISKDKQIRCQRFPIDHRIDKRCSRSKARQNHSPILSSIAANSTLDIPHIEGGSTTAESEDDNLTDAELRTDYPMHNGTLSEGEEKVRAAYQKAVLRKSKLEKNYSPGTLNEGNDETTDNETSVRIAVGPLVSDLDSAASTLSVPNLMLSSLPNNTGGATWNVPQPPWIQGNLPVSSQHLILPGKSGTNSELSQSPSTECRGQCDCPFCGMVLANKNNLKNHINSVHTHSKTYTCHICCKVYYSNSALNIHRRRNHYTFNKRYKCSACSKLFKIKSDLSAHMCEVHSRQKELDTMKSMDTTSVKLERPRGSSFTSVESDLSSDELIGRTKDRLESVDISTNTENGSKDPPVVVENATKRNTDNGSQAPDDKEEVNSENVDDSLWYTTEPVGIITASQSESDPESHESENAQSPASKRKKLTTGQGFSCTRCDSILSSKHNLQVHIKSVHIRDCIYSCEHCGKTSYSQSAIRIHRSRHHGNGRACRCEVCGAEFKIASDLAAHLNRKHQIFSKK